MSNEPRMDVVEAARRSKASGLYDRPEVFDAAAENCIARERLVEEQYEQLAAQQTN